MKRIFLFADPRKAKALQTALSLQEWLHQKKLHAVIHDSTQRITRHLKNFDLVVSLGGDGTLLFLAHTAAPLSIPILAVDLGGLGFLATVPPSAAKRVLSLVLAGSFKVEKRMMLAVSILSGKRIRRRMLALNEVAIHKESSERLIHLTLQIGGEDATTYSADGLIVATPTGSTAYSLSAGGPIVSPKLEAFVITPICPHALSSRPMVTSSSEWIHVESAKPNRTIKLTLDGQESFKVREGKIQIERARETCNLIQIQNDFYHKLKTKLQWAGEYQRLNLGKNG